MCHRSYANENPGVAINDNERLEYLGDAVLDLVVANQLLGTFPEHREGELTRIRAELVAEPSLVRLAQKLELGGCLLLGRGESLSGGATKPSLLADALEALFGAVFLDAGFETASRVIEPLVRTMMKQAARHAGQDYKSRLQEYLQSRQEGLPDYVLLAADGPDHDRTYHVQVLVNQTVCGEGHGRTKKKAEQAAAHAALQRLGAG